MRTLKQVLIGLRDNHDDLVSASLHALAEMVPILGAEIVVGSNRHPVFKEGKPKVYLEIVVDRLLSKRIVICFVIFIDFLGGRVQ